MSKSQLIKIANRNNEMLSAIIERPPVSTQGKMAVLAHCFTCGKNLRAARFISDSLVSRGFTVLRFDFTGLGQSSGDFAQTSFTANLDDLVSVATWLTENEQPPTLLVGHSLGGAAVVHAAANIPSVRAVATVGAPFDPAHVSHLFPQGAEELADEDTVDLNLGAHPVKISGHFVRDLRQHNASEVARNLRCALLVMHSPIDAIVGVDNASSLFTAAKHPKSFVSLDNADHLLTKEADARYAGETIAAWAGRYLTTAASTVETEEQGVARISNEEGFTTQMLFGGHAFLADEPQSLGGENLGPSPYDLINAGLGACTAMTLKMYARRKNIPFDDITVHLNHKRRRVDDVEACMAGEVDADQQGNFDQFERLIEITGDVTDEQRQRMLEIADRCPVHRSMERRSTIITKLRN